MLKGSENFVRIQGLLVDYYGPESQRFVFLGELGELQEAVSSGDRAAIVEELADVTIMLTQRFLICDIVDRETSELPAIDNLTGIINQVLIQEGRLTQGREYKCFPLYALAKWVETKTAEIEAKDEVSDVVVSKLERQLVRMRQQTGRDTAIQSGDSPSD